MKEVACLSLNCSCGFGFVRASSLIRSSRSLKPSCVMMAFLQLGKFGPVSLGMLVRSMSSAMAGIDALGGAVRLWSMISVALDGADEW